MPANNPFVGVPGALPEIWSYGLRNPWRFSFDRVTNDLTLGDVGQNRTRRSTSDPSTPAGGARSTSAGAASRAGTSTARATRTAIRPIPTSSRRSSSTPHSGRSACSITGGYVVRDQEVPSLLGRYLYSDYCNGAIYSNILQIPDVQDDVPNRARCGQHDLLRGGLVRSRLRGRAVGEPERLAHPPDRPAGPVLHPAVQPARSDRARRGRLHDRARRTQTAKTWTAERCPKAPTRSSSTTTRRSTTSTSPADPFPASRSRAVPRTSRPPGTRPGP